ncbi:hypothetical protein [Desulfonema magnum]|uniref:Uncharacterized protein n=1 Tax=Desulfonema magnum TaxID=45655 RepID=A0A975BHY3_9BACT|nr:hypothetical protein [Desulfonema magnum]QTA85610.1 Uncharacterized protein dnm_016210 [Desulfonema magnum]
MKQTSPFSLSADGKHLERSRSHASRGNAEQTLRVTKLPAAGNFPSADYQQIRKF